MNKPKLTDLVNLPGFKLLNPGKAMEREISTIYCCDLLSRVMGNAPMDCVWITVMANMNAIAVSLLADCAAIVLAEGVVLGEDAEEKAAEQGICILATDLPIYEAAKQISVLLPD